MTNELYHHGILGQKWGVRRYQNEDGSLTSEGRARYDVGEARRAAVEGGLIGYAKYKRTHQPKTSDDVKRYKVERIQAKAARKIAKREKKDSKLLNTREKNLSKINEKYDRKIKIAKYQKKSEEVKNLKDKKAAAIKDFNEGTKYIAKAQKFNNSTISKYYNEKAKTIGDKDYKYSTKYKEAAREFTKLMGNEMYYGRGMTMLITAGEMARKNN